MFLLDTSVLTRLSAPPVVRRIEDLDDKGLARTTMTDLEIGCSTGHDRSSANLHYDADSDHIATVTGQPTQWIVERGSID